MGEASSPAGTACTLSKQDFGAQKWVSSKTHGVGRKKPRCHPLIGQG